MACRVPQMMPPSSNDCTPPAASLLGEGKSDEFAYNFTSETSVFGAARNPWNPECSPGGSSGGSAIAVASSMCLAALRSDTGGSIRLPAAFCQITALSLRMDGYLRRLPHLSPGRWIT